MIGVVVASIVSTVHPTVSRRIHRAVDRPNSSSAFLIRAEVQYCGVEVRPVKSTQRNLTGRDETVYDA